MPGKVIVIVVGELTSYFLCGFLHIFRRIRMLNMVFEITATKTSMGGGKKLQHKSLIHKFIESRDFTNVTY